MSYRDENNYFIFDDKEPITEQRESDSFESVSKPCSWRDAEFVEGHEDFTPKIYNNVPPEKPPVVKTKKTMSAAAIISLSLALSLVGGAAGSFGVYSYMDAQATELEQQADALALPAPESTSTPIITTSATDTISPMQIYNNGVEETVGISTEIITTNYFGMQSPSSVTGSGFIISEDGYIITNFHVVENAYYGGYTVDVMLHDGTEYPAEIMGFDDDNDIAVLKIDATGLNPVTVGDSDNLAVGEAVYAIGNPLGELAYSLTDGIVSATNRLISIPNDTTGEVNTINMFQSNAAINDGNSGGPIYNAYGQVIGVVTAKYGASGVEGLGFAIPINDAMDIANDIITKGYVSGKAYMGVTGQTVTESAAYYYNMSQGAYISTVEKGSSADLAGLKIGDIIVEFNNIDILTFEELSAAVRAQNAFDTVTMTVWRSGEYIDLEITLDELVPTQG